MINENTRTSWKGEKKARRSREKTHDDKRTEEERARTSWEKRKFPTRDTRISVALYFDVIEKRVRAVCDREIKHKVQRNGLTNERKGGRGKGLFAIYEYILVK